MKIELIWSHKTNERKYVSDKRNRRKKSTKEEKEGRERIEDLGNKRYKTISNVKRNLLSDLY